MRSSTLVKVGSLEVGTALTEKDVAVLEMSSAILLALSKRDQTTSSLEAVNLYTITQEQV